MDESLFQNCVFLITILLVFIFLLWDYYNHVLYIYFFSIQDIHKYWNIVNLWIKMQETADNLLKLLNGLVMLRHVTSHLYVISHSVMSCSVMS